MGSCIQLSSQTPPKLRIPVSASLQYDFSLLDNETVAELESKVKQESGIKSFKVALPDKKLKLEEATKSKFSIEVNKKTYEVYPVFETMVEK